MLVISFPCNKVLHHFPFWPWDLVTHIEQVRNRKKQPSCRRHHLEALLVLFKWVTVCTWFPTFPKTKALTAQGIRIEIVFLSLYTHITFSQAISPSSAFLNIFSITLFPLCYSETTTWAKIFQASKLHLGKHKTSFVFLPHLYPSSFYQWFHFLYMGQKILISLYSTDIQMRYWPVAF